MVEDYDRWMRKMWKMIKTLEEEMEEVKGRLDKLEKRGEVHGAVQEDKSEAEDTRSVKR